MTNAFYIIGFILILFNLYNTIKLGKPLTDMYEYEQNFASTNITHEMITEIIWIIFVYGEFGWLIWGSIGAPNYKYFLCYIASILIISIISDYINNDKRTESQCAVKTLIDAICEFMLMYGCFYNI